MTDELNIKTYICVCICVAMIHLLEYQDLIPLRELKRLIKVEGST